MRNKKVTSKSVSRLLFFICWTQRMNCVSSANAYRSWSAPVTPFPPRWYPPASSHLSSLRSDRKSIEKRLCYIQIRVATSFFYLWETGWAKPQLECVQECVWFTVQSWLSMPMEHANVVGANGVGDFGWWACDEGWWCCWQWCC